MTDFITVSIHPFDAKQKISIYQNGDCIDTLECDLDDIEKAIIKLSDEYNIKQINLIESPTYGLKIKEHLLFQYSDKKLNINIW